MGDVEPAQIVCRLVGVPDGNPGHLWSLWSGAEGAHREARRRLLTVARESPDGERAIAGLVTYSVLRGLQELTDLAGPEAIVRAFANLTLEDLTSLADNPARMLDHLARESPRDDDVSSPS